MTTPTISVVMSVFNGERFLREAVESILDQSFRDFEFIIVDDGSTDGSASILDSYERSDPRVRVYHQKNSGVTEGRNRGCRLSGGKYLAQMDQDDIAVRDRLSWQIEFMEKHPEVAVLGGAMEFIDEAGRSLRVEQYPVEDREIKATLPQYCCMMQPTVLIRKDALAPFGGYRKGFADVGDYDLWLRMAERFQLANLNAVVLKYRIHPDQVSQRRVRQQALNTLAAQAAASSRRNGNPDLLTSVQGITPATLVWLGVSEATQQRAVAAAYLVWIRNMSVVGGGSAALNLAAELLSPSNRGYLEKHMIADARLAVAGIYWKQRRFFRSLLAAGHAVTTHPIMIGRPLKLLFRRLKLALQG